MDDVTNSSVVTPAEPLKTQSASGRHNPDKATPYDEDAT
jgi:hypothetical protein